MKKDLYQYIVKEHPQPKAPVPTVPPSTDPTPDHDAAIFLLSLMEDPDNSADGIAHVSRYVAIQYRIVLEYMSQFVQIMQGDLGSRQNDERLHRKQYSEGFPEGCQKNILTFPGGLMLCAMFPEQFSTVIEEIHKMMSMVGNGQKSTTVLRGLVESQILELEAQDPNPAIDQMGFVHNWRVR